MLRIYITDIQSYNEGSLIGKWIELPMNSDDLNDEIREVLTNGAAECGNDEHEEIFITDYEFTTETKLFDVEEYSNIEDLNEKCEELEDFDEDDLKRIAYLIDYVGYEFDDALQRYDEVSIYEDSTMEDIVEQYIDETVDFSNIPDIIARNIDYSSIARDWEISGEFDSIDGDIYHFVNC